MEKTEYLKGFIMTKEKLIELGLTEEQAKAVMGELDGNYIPKSRFNDINDELKTAKKTISERDNQLETLKKSNGDIETLREQIATLQKDNKTKDETHAAEIKKIRIDNAIEKALTDSKARNTKAVKALLDLTNAEIDDDGTIKGLSEQIKKLTEADDSKFLFETEQSNGKGFVPGQGKDGSGGSPDFSKMSYDDIADYISKNPETKL